MRQFSKIFFLFFFLLFGQNSLAQITNFFTASTEFQGTGTYYGYTSGGQCSLDPLPSWISDTSGPTYPSISAAITTNSYYSSASCGMCINITGSGTGSGANPIIGPITALIADSCPSCPGTYDIDLGSLGDGAWDISWIAIPCPVVGAVQFILQGSNSNYIKLQCRNSVYPVQSIQIISPQSVVLTRTSDNFFCGSPSNLVAPFQVQVTSIFGESITESIPSITSGTVFDGVNQFSVGPSSSATLPPVVSNTPSSSAAASVSASNSGISGSITSSVAASVSASNSGVSGSITSSVAASVSASNSGISASASNSGVSASASNSGVSGSITSSVTVSVSVSNSAVSVSSSPSGISISNSGPQTVTSSASPAVTSSPTNSLTPTQSTTGSGSQSTTGSGSQSTTGSGSQSTTGSGTNSISQTESRSLSPLKKKLPSPSSLPSNPCAANLKKKTCVKDPTCHWKTIHKLCIYACNRMYFTKASCSKHPLCRWISRLNVCSYNPTILKQQENQSSSPKAKKQKKKK